MERLSNTWICETVTTDHPIPPRRPDARSLALSDITISTRHRTDLGDLAGLKQSISDVGLLHPVVVTTCGLLIAGERRLEAVRQLGWKTVPVHVVKNLETAASLLHAERDENTCRKDLALSEMVALADKLGPLEEELARDRQAVRSEKFSTVKPDHKGRAKDRIATMVGTSRPTLAKAKDVIEAARENPEAYGHFVDKMDKAGRVDGIHRQVKAMQQAEQYKQSPVPLPDGRFKTIVIDPPWSWGAGVHVGQRVRQRRYLAGMTQRELGDKVGIKFQQVHKYETGANRVSASRIWEIAAALDVPVSFLFEGLDGQAPDIGLIRGDPCTGPIRNAERRAFGGFLVIRSGRSRCGAGRVHRRDSRRPARDARRRDRRRSPGRRMPQLGVHPLQGAVDRRRTSLPSLCGLCLPLGAPYPHLPGIETN